MNKALIFVLLVNRVTLPISCVAVAVQHEHPCHLIFTADVANQCAQHNHLIPTLHAQQGALLDIMSQFCKCNQPVITYPCKIELYVSTAWCAYWSLQNKAVLINTSQAR